MRTTKIIKQNKELSQNEKLTKEEDPQLLKEECLLPFF